ncbi:MAG: hypothetical protein ACLPS1_25080 [Streptosporangiaceae bacterium]
MVANAGIAIGGPFADSDPAAFDRVIEVNLLGPFAGRRPPAPPGWPAAMRSLTARSPGCHSLPGDPRAGSAAAQ